MNTLKCKNCGHSTLYMGTDYYDEKCELCGQKMYPKEEPTDKDLEIGMKDNKLKKALNEIKEHLGKKDCYTIEEILEMDLISSMEDNIKSMGHRRTWESIEHIKNAKQRIVFRRGFFKAGGRI